MKNLTPRKIVEELDKYIIGQDEAKKCVAIAIRNRWRRQQLAPDLRDEVIPKNIILIGPTGVGKTEIARRLAQLVQAPFLKVEASKYTEVGYHGRDVDSMIRDLTEIAVNMVRLKAVNEVETKAHILAEERLLQILLPSTARHNQPQDTEETQESTKEKLRKQLNAGQLDKKLVELKVEGRVMPMMQVFSGASFEEYGMDLQNMLGDMFPTKKVTKKVPVHEARQILINQEAEKLIDREKVIKEGIAQVENAGIIFIDEIDKIIARGQSHGPDVSREGVQRDLLPIVEGGTIPTRYGTVRTHHILFVAAGAFSATKPSDLIPELQGRFPIRAELNSLGKSEFIRILTEPQNALLKQYQALLATEGITIKFQKEAIDELAQIASEVNNSTQNIGARRLYTVVEKVLEEISFEAPDLPKKTVNINRAYVRNKLKSILISEDLKRYIL